MPLFYIFQISSVFDLEKKHDSPISAFNSVAIFTHHVTSGILHCTQVKEGK